MSPRQPLFFAPLAATALAVLAIGCGSSDGGSGYGSRDSTEGAATATATTPDAPPGASARTCESAAAGAEELRVTGISCYDGLRTVAEWTGERSCATPAGGSRFSCSIDNDYRCVGTSAERGIAVSCSRPGASVSFVVKPG
jgi:hypothetical protein